MADRLSGRPSRTGRWSSLRFSRRPISTFRPSVLAFEVGELLLGEPACTGSADLLAVGRPHVHGPRLIGSGPHGSLLAAPPPHDACGGFSCPRHRPRLRHGQHRRPGGEACPAPARSRTFADEGQDFVAGGLVDLDRCVGRSVALAGALTRPPRSSSSSGHALVEIGAERRDSSAAADCPGRTRKNWRRRSSADPCSPSPHPARQVRVRT